MKSLVFMSKVWRLKVFLHHSQKLLWRLSHDVSNYWYLPYRTGTSTVTETGSERYGTLRYVTVGWDFFKKNKLIIVIILPSGTYVLRSNIIIVIFDVIIFKNNLDPSLTPTENLKKTGLTAKVNADINSCGVPTGVDLESKGHKAVEFLVF